MTYGATTYGGTTLGSGTVTDTDVTARAPERTLVRTIRATERELQL